MLVELYGDRDREGYWSWHTTLDRDGDRMGKPGGETACVERIRFKPWLSMGQAVWLRDKLNAACRKGLTPSGLRRTVEAACRQMGLSPERMAGIGLVRESGRTDRIQGNTEGQPNNGFLPASTSSRAPLDNRVLDQVIRALAGRFLLPEELGALMEDSGLGAWKGEWKRYVQAGISIGALRIMPGMSVSEGSVWNGGRLLYTCRRCGSGGAGLRWVECADCGGLCPYCEQCLGMGKIRSCSILISGVVGGGGPSFGVEHAALRAELPLDHWGLSPAQKEAALAGLRYLERPGEGGCRAEDRFLIWAVTGAGKTEMIFPLVERELSRGGRVLITTPRKDVVLELKPRLAKAFADRRVTALYGGSEDRWECGDITLSTTHQLMRFYRAFDLVIIDEIDAFPYHGNPLLQFAAGQVCTEHGHVVLLSATPPRPLQRLAARGRLPHVRVPVRYHRHPLPVPERIAIPPLGKILERQALPVGLHRRLEASVSRGAQAFLFVPKILWVEPMVQLLRRLFPGVGVEGTSSVDEERTGKVSDFRSKEIRILVTTTILERGVTIPRSDVYILGADSSLFDEAALVQMAGRAGRSGDDPNGKVVFASADWTRSQAGAVRQIRTMNRIAAAKGYLLGTPKRTKGWGSLWKWFK